jgi:hypothetical protein
MYRTQVHVQHDREFQYRPGRQAGSQAARQAGRHNARGSSIQTILDHIIILMKSYSTVASRNPNVIIMIHVSEKYGLYSLTTCCF